MSGTLRDISGAVLPGAQLTLTSTVSDIRATAVSEPSGAFAFRSVPPSTYLLVAQLPGFSTLKTELLLGSGQNLQVGSLTLQVGTLVETITTVCAPAAAAVAPALRSLLAFDRRAASPRLFRLRQEPAAATAALAAQIVPIRVGGQIAVPRRIKDAKATCPAGVKPDEGAVVIFEATIGVDGLVKDVKALRAGDRPEFVQSAGDAIRQWEYTPTRLNDVPIPVTITVTAIFAAK